MGLGVLTTLGLNGFRYTVTMVSLFPALSELLEASADAKRAVELVSA